MLILLSTDAVLLRFSVKKVLLQIKENTRKIHRKTPTPTPTSFSRVFSCEFCETFRSTFFDRRPPVAASVSTLFDQNLCCSMQHNNLADNRGIATSEFFLTL